MMLDKKRVLVFEFHQESNTFNPMILPMKDFLLTARHGEGQPLLRLPSLCRPVLPQLPQSSSFSSHLGWEPLGPCQATRGPRVLMPALCTPGPAWSTHIRPPRQIQTRDCVFSPGADDCVNRDSAIPSKTLPRQAVDTFQVSSLRVCTTGQG